MSANAPKTSYASRYLFLFLVGLLVGAVAVVMLLRTLEARKTWQDHFPHATMQLMQVHMAQLGDTRQANRCKATDVVQHVQALRMLANDLEPAFPGIKDDARFGQHASQLRADLDSATLDLPQDCAGIEVLTKKIGESCKACHQDFRS